MLSASPLALCSTFSLIIGAGAFMVLAALPNGPLQRQGVRSNVDARVRHALALPWCSGLVAACFGFQDQSAAVALLRDHGGAALILAAVADVLLACAAVAYCLCVNLGKDAEGRRRRALLRIVGALAALFSCASGLAHLAVPEPSLGDARHAAADARLLAARRLRPRRADGREKAGALDDPSVKRLLTVAAVLGAVLGVGGFSAQVLAEKVSEMAGAAGAGADLVRAASMHIAVGVFCLAATLVFGVMAIRMKETGFHSVIAVASGFVGVSCSACAWHSTPCSLREPP